MRPRLELLEERLAPGTLAVSGSALDLVLGTGEQVAIVSDTWSSAFSLGTGQTWSGTNGGYVSGSGLQSLAITSTGLTDFSTGIDIADTGSSGGDGVALDASGARTRTRTTSPSL